MRNLHTQDTENNWHMMSLVVVYDRKYSQLAPTPPADESLHRWGEVEDPCVYQIKGELSLELYRFKPTPRPPPLPHLPLPPP